MVLLKIFILQHDSEAVVNFLNKRETQPQLASSSTNRVQMKLKRGLYLCYDIGFSLQRPRPGQSVGCMVDKVAQWYRLLLQRFDFLL
jgi:hypothetical protein